MNSAVTVTQPRTRPILFKGEMVRAILEGYKTQTRRAILPAMLTKPCPYGAIGDTLWVRETFCEIDGKFVYKASVPKDFRNPTVWTPSIFMPFSANRIRLKIIGVKKERLTTISEADALKEGIIKLKNGRHFLEIDRTSIHADRASEVFRMLWNYINGEGSWEANPMVWAIEFERLNNNG